MKNLIFKFGDWLCELGERHGLRFLVYNPITWGRFFFSARRAGLAFGAALKENFPAVRSVVDVGAGSGGYVARLRQLGFEATGVEYSSVGRFFGWIQGVKILPFDCSSEAGRPQLPDVDLAYSIEVGEHLPDSLADDFVSYISQRSGIIVFSAAFPGQGGQGHINEQPQEYWRAKFEGVGMRYQPSASASFSDSLTRHGFRGWLPKNVQVFTKV